MAEDQPADVGGEPTFVHTPGGTGPLSPRDAARSLTDARAKANAAPPPDKQPERAPPATAAEESAPEADAARRDDGPGEDVQEVDPAEQEPSIEPPERWTHEAKEHWQSIPHATQEYITKRERERDALLLQSKNQADEQLKGLTAREQAMEQARLQFENLNQAMLQEYQMILQGDFADIKTMDDVSRLADEDWARYNKWQVHQQRIALKKAQAEDGLQRQAQEAQAKFAKFAEEQDKAFIAEVPEFADKEKAAELQSAAMKTLRNIGFTEDELTKHWNSMSSLSLREKKVQVLVQKATRWDMAQEAKKTVTAKKDLPPVQRPGVARQGDSKLAQIQTIQKQLNNATGMAALRLATQLTKLQRESGPH